MPDLTMRRAPGTGLGEDGRAREEYALVCGLPTPTFDDFQTTRATAHTTKENTHG